MPIAVRCACGKSINAPDQLAGKKAKCPSCGAALSIPDGASAKQSASKATTGGPTSAAKELPIYVTCECGKKLTAPAKMAGKSVQCPTCRQLVKIPKAAESTTASGNKPVKDGLADLLDEVDLSRSKTGHRCPECRADLQPDDILCIQCGYNLESGKKLVTKTIEKKPKLGGHGHGHGGGGKPSGPPKQEKTKETAPPAIKGLIKLLQMVGNLGVLVGFLITAYMGYRAYQANPQQDYIEMAIGVATAALPVLVGFIVLLTVPATAAVGMLYQGKPAGRILAIIVGILGLPLAGLGALVLRGAFSDEVTRYCS